MLHSHFKYIISREVSHFFKRLKASQKIYICQYILFLIAVVQSCTRSAQETESKTKKQILIVNF